MSEIHIKSLIAGGVIGSVLTGLVLGLAVAILFRPTIPTTSELDVAIVKTVFGEAKEFCTIMKAKHYEAEASGLNIRAGCRK